MSERTGSDKQDSPKRKSAESENVLVRLVSWISAALVLSAIAWLAYEGLQPDAPPAFDIVVKHVHAEGGRHHVRFSVRNDGSESVENLRLRLRLMSQGGIAESAEAVVAWVPAHSRREGAAVFALDPSLYEIEVDIVSYQLP